MILVETSGTQREKINVKAAQLSGKDICLENLDFYQFLKAQLRLVSVVYTGNLFI